MTQKERGEKKHVIGPWRVSAVERKWLVVVYDSPD